MSLVRQYTKSQAHAKQDRLQDSALPHGDADLSWDEGWNFPSHVAPLPMRIVTYHS